MITGKIETKTFETTPATAPSSNYQVANKKYVDDTVIGIGTSGSIVMGFSTVGGDGSDGNVIISSATNINNSLKQYNNLTINPSQTLTAYSSFIGVKGTLTVNGTISAVGGGYAGGARRIQGLGFPGTNADLTYSCGGSGGGGQGAFTSPANPSLNGGDGGATAGGAGGVGGLAAGSPGHAWGGNGNTCSAAQARYVKYFFRDKIMVAGGAGGGGGGHRTNYNGYGGAGGTGGGWIFIECNILVMNIGGIITANGSAGEDGNEWGGGGGGGGGGTIFIRYKTYTTALGNITVSGGAGGQLGILDGTYGGTGGAGTIILQQL